MKGGERVDVEGVEVRVEECRELRKQLSRARSVKAFSSAHSWLPVVKASVVGSSSTA